MTTSPLPCARSGASGLTTSALLGAALLAGSPASAQVLEGANLTFQNNLGTDITLLTPTSLPLTQFSGVAVNPSNPDDIYFTTRGTTRGGQANPSGGFFRSLDGGATFERTSGDVGVFDNAIDSFGITSALPDRLIVVQEDEARSASNVNISFDRGATFVRGATSTPPGFNNVISVEVSPTDPDTVFFGADSGAYVSFDGGFTIERAPAPLPSDTSVAAFTPVPSIASNLSADGEANVFVGVRQRVAGFYRSNDNGQSFEFASNGLTVFANNAGPRAGAEVIAVGQDDPDRIYVGLFLDTTQNVFRSDDGGDSFERLRTVPRSEFVPTGFQNVVRGFAVDPLDADRFVLATNNAQVLFSDDAGESFTDLGFLFEDISFNDAGRIRVQTALGEVRTGRSPLLATSTTGGGPGFGAFNVVFDPNDRGRVLVSTSFGLYAVAVPEPATGLLAASLAGLALPRRRRDAAA